MTEAATTPTPDYVPGENVTSLPTPPRLRVVKTLEEAERQVVDASARVSDAIDKAKKKSRKPRAKPVDPILSASQAGGTQPSDAAPSPTGDVRALAEESPAVPQAAGLNPFSPVGSEVLLDHVVETSFPPSLATSAATRVSLSDRLRRGWAWVRLLLIAAALVALGIWAAASA